MYRFRSVENLLTEHNELERQAVFFAAPEELSDTAEATLVWGGDIVKWRNLLANYLLCVFHTALSDTDDFALPIYETESALSEEHVALYQKAEVSFFVQKIVAELTHVLAGKKTAVKREEVLFYLKCIHNTAAGAVAQVLGQETKAVLEKTNGFEKAFLDQTVLLAKPAWFAACFLTNCTDNVVWERYGQDHQGVCLKYRDKEIYGQKTLALTWQEVPGEEQDEEEQESPEYFNHTFKQVGYTDEPIVLNFFDAVGDLPLPDAVQQWYSAGSMSDKVMQDASFGAWMKRFWQQFERSVTTKPAQFAADGEYRIILSEHFLERDDKAGRTFSYAFDDLEAVIFGAKTPDLVRVEIIDIIERKCNETGRQSFDFYQAKQVPGSGEVELIKLDWVQSMVEL